MPGKGKKMTGARRNTEWKGLEVVLKCDTTGTLEAVMSALKSRSIAVVHAGVGPVSKSDLFQAVSAGRLVVAFGVDVLPRIESLSKEKGVEVRIYQTIYTLTQDLEDLASGLVPQEPEERITGTAKVIALFKSSRKGIILGCDVTGGEVATGRQFRIVSGPGPVYAGRIESLHIEENEVQRAKPGQQVGVKISGFKRGRIGDLLECFETVRPKDGATWKPKGGVLRRE